MNSPKNPPEQPREDRCPGMSYTDMLNADTRPAPEFLLAESNQQLGDDPIPVEHYISEDWARQEAEKMWPNVWQFAAREEDMPEPGDRVVYDINDTSVLLVRQSDGSIKAFYNACLHRGRQIHTEDGTSSNLKCPYHGFTWELDGKFRELPCGWDFRHLENKDLSLPELKVDRWQGFILITENHDLPPFREWVGPGVEHYERWRLDECYTAGWVGRIIPANWKTTAEAFMEAYHAVVTHPQILGFTADANTRYDLYGDFMNRAITPAGVTSPHIKGKDQEFVLDTLEKFMNVGSIQNRRGLPDKQALAEYAEDDPLAARKVLAEKNRETLHAANGYDYSEFTDSEMMDNMTYNFFPNWSPWGGMVPNIIYRWRPVRDVDHCLMEIRILMRTPKGEKPPKTAPMTLVREDQTFVEGAGHVIGESLAGVFDQDLANVPYVQRGMKSLQSRGCELGHYQESRIRHFHLTLSKYVNGELP